MARKSSSSSSSSKVQNKKKSICEKSLLLVANIIKLSSLAFVSINNCGTSQTTVPGQKKNYSDHNNFLSSSSSAKAAYYHHDHDHNLDLDHHLILERTGGNRRMGHVSKKQPLLMSGSERHGVSYVMIPPIKDSPPKPVEFKDLSTLERMVEDFIKRKHAQHQRQQ
jgi:hypothetical protein|uniref:Uncharacterized protein n=1 Tax=Cannabis sativa TaxID=3483 RepID=A0A803QZW2_CANSA